MAVYKLLQKSKGRKINSLRGFQHQFSIFRKIILSQNQLYFVLSAEVSKTSKNACLDICSTQGSGIIFNKQRAYFRKSFRKKDTSQQEVGKEIKDEENHY